MVDTMFHSNLTSVRKLWEASAADPIRLGSYCKGEVSKYLLEWEGQAHSGEISYSLVSGMARTGIEIKAVRGPDELAERYLRLSVASARYLKNEPNPEESFADTSTPVNTDNAKAFCGLALAQSAMDPLSPPDRMLLNSAAAMFRRWAFQETQSFDNITRGYVLQGVLASLACHDLEKARELIEIRKRMPEKQAKLLRNICKYAGLETRDGKSYVRIAHPKALESFFGLFNMFRVPDAQTFYRMWGEDWCIFVASGSYLLTWLYFQSVECIDDEAVTWPMIAEVMTY